MALKSKNKSEKTKAPKENLKKKAPKEDVVEAPAEYVNTAETEALTEQHEADTAVLNQISMRKMEKAVEVVQNEFNLTGKNYTMNLFDDKGKKCVLAVSNEDFDVIVTIRDTEKYDIR